MASHDHWDDVYSSKAADEVSWFQSEPAESLRHITSIAGPSASVVDVGSGASVLVDRLLDLGHHDITVVDISATALAEVQRRLGERSVDVSFVATDVLHWTPGRTFDVWHDRAVFHFLTGRDQRERYAVLAGASVAPGGHLIVSTFAPDGPAQCSGLDVSRYDAEGLTAELGPAFTLVASDREEHRTPWGAVQPFTWVVLRRDAT